MTSSVNPDYVTLALLSIGLCGGLLLIVTAGADRVLSQRIWEYIGVFAVSMMVAAVVSFAVLHVRVVP